MAWALGKSQKPATLSKDFLLDIRESRGKKIAQSNTTGSNNF